MSQSAIFKIGKTQAICLPKAVALPEHIKRVEIVKQGNGRLIIPAGESWDVFFASPRLDDDFLEYRAQPAPQRRNSD